MEATELVTPECLQKGKKVTLKRAILNEDGSLSIPEKSRKKTGILNETVRPQVPLKFDRPRGDKHPNPYGQVVSSKVQKTLEIMGTVVVQTQRTLYAVLQ